MKTAYAIIDTDIHALLDSHRVLDYLPEPWRTRYAGGSRGPGHLGYWNPNGVTVEPLLQKAKAGANLKATLVVTNALTRPRKLEVTLEGRGVAMDQSWTVEVGAGATLRRPFALQLGEKTPVGRQVLVLRVVEDGRVDSCDAFVVVDIDG